MIELNNNAGILEHVGVLDLEVLSFKLSLLPTAIKAEEEKIFEEFSTGNQSGVEEKSLVDTVYDLKDEVKALRSKMAAMCTQMQEERSARGQLQSAVHNLLTTSPKT